MSITMKPKAPRGSLNKKATPKSKAKAMQLVAGPGLPPSMTSQTLPDGIAALDPDCREAAQEASQSQAQPPEQVELSEVKDLRCDWLWRHPINRVPTPAEIRAIRDDLVDTGQLEPIVVWECDSPDNDSVGIYQIISGETRWLAAQELGWPTLQGRIVQSCDERLALQLLAHYNGLRNDLNPMQKAQLIESLCEGTGYTREQAAKAVGLQSGSAASNLVRLLELPQVWQDRVAAGELPESFARLLVPLAKAPKLLDAMDKEWRECRQAEEKGLTWYEQAFRSRTELEEYIDNLIDDETRLIEDALFAIDEQTLAKLAVIEVTVANWEGGKKKTSLERVATNVELFDKLQTAAEAKQTKKKAGKSADADEKQAAKKKALTPAQQREKEKERAQQLATRITAWRHRWLCALVAERLVNYDEAQSAFVAWLLAGGGSFHDRDLAEAGLTKLGHKVKDHEWELDKKLWKFILSNEVDAQNGLPQFDALNAMCKFALGFIDKDPKYLKLSEVIDDLARWCYVDLETEWRVIQQEKESNPRYEEFLLLHNGDQLDTLGKELGAFVEGQKTKAAKVQALLSAPRTLPLPKAIKLLVKEEPKAKGKKKAKASK